VGVPTDEETAKIKKVKGILNKLTPENFGRLFQQMIDVEINNATTLTMVIAQVFEKALLEPGFCELYAEFSKNLQTQLPEFLVRSLVRFCFFLSAALLQVESMERPCWSPGLASCLPSCPRTCKRSS
jgi:hypothetical protein